MIADLQVYVVGPQDKSAISSVIFAFSDVFGPRTGRHVRICDEIAAAMPGSLVCMPDFFDDCPICGLWPGPVSLSLLGGFSTVYRIRYTYGWGDMWPTLVRLMGALRDRVGRRVPRLCYGFCWGGWLAYKCSTTGEFDAAAGFHPSLLVNMLQQSPHNDDEEAFARAIRCPLLSLPASNDEKSLKPGGAFIELVKKRHPASRAKEYAEMLHGWVNRGTEPDAVITQDSAPDAVAEAQQAAVLDAVTFFRGILAGCAKHPKGVRSPREHGFARHASPDSAESESDSLTSSLGASSPACGC